MKLLTASLLLAMSCWAQSPTKRGEEVFAKSCATGYCHGVRGQSSGAPRLAGRGFNQAYINNVVMRGIPGTGMASFATTLSRADLIAVVAYVATLNGIVHRRIGSDDDTAPASTGPKLTGDAARGARLFTEAVRGFGRCSTCHEVDGFGVSVAAPIQQVPVSVAALKALATPSVKTGTLDGESMPVLVLSEGKQSTLFYDLTSAPPVERNAQPGSVKFTDGSNWRHSSVIGAYNDAELGAILAYLRAATRATQP
jgi:mono/diheme cytochrome c family protein